MSETTATTQCPTCKPRGARRPFCETCLAATNTRVAALLALPAVAAILDRAGRLTAEEKARLHAAWISHYRIYRREQSDLSHRCSKEHGENWRDLLAAKERVRLAERDGLDPYEGDMWGASFAAEDAAYVELAGDLIQPGEQRVFDGPWRAVIGETIPPADVLQRELARVVRGFQRYTAEQRAGRAASHRLGHRQRTAVGEEFFTHPDLPGRAFDTRKAAALAAIRTASKGNLGRSEDPLKAGMGEVAPLFALHALAVGGA